MTLRTPTLSARFCALASTLVLLGGCNAIVLDPAGDVARQQADLVIISTVLMLLIIVPVMALTVLFAWRYRRSNTEARYEPEWDHSMQLELAIWAAPLLIVICLGAVTWMGTHLLDPFRPLGRVAADKPVPADARPLTVEVAALDWKWLFIYPEYGVATVNELAVPVDRPIQFRITSSSVMNSFYVPALAGQIYAMPGMETKLHAVLNKPVESVGFSANYSGAGFSKMRFRFQGLTEADFAKWVDGVKAAPAKLDRATYLTLAQPSEGVPAQHYAAADPNLFDGIVNMCVEPGKMCMRDVMAIDARGGGGHHGHDVQSLIYDKYGRPKADPTVVGALCGPPGKDAQQAATRPDASAPSAAPLVGAGLPRPGGSLFAQGSVVRPRTNS